MTSMITKEIIDRIFKEPGIKYALAEFESLGKPIHDIKKPKKSPAHGWAFEIMPDDDLLSHGESPHYHRR